MSKARTQTLEPLLLDVGEVNSAHRNLRTGLPGRQWNLAGLNRSAVVLTVSAWEAYVEDLARECVEALKPSLLSIPSGNQTWPLDAWPSIKSATEKAIARFNNPTPKNVIALFSTAIGMPDVSSGWRYRGCSQPRAVKYLDALLTKRHEVAHGTNPRPPVHSNYAAWAPQFIRRIAECMDATVRDHLVNVLGVSPPW